MKLHACFIGQRVSAKVGTPLYERGCREGDIYFIGRELVNAEFDYLGTVAALPPAEIEPVS